MDPKINIANAARAGASRLFFIGVAGGATSVPQLPLT
jgi:hypothetical protein